MSLADRAKAAQAAVAEGDDTKACEMLDALTSQVKAKSGKRVDSSTAEALTSTPLGSGQCSAA